MILNPKIGNNYQVWYRKENNHLPLHSKIGAAVIKSTGKPRNHGVLIDGIIYVVPCGNLRKSEDQNLVEFCDRIMGAQKETQQGFKKFVDENFWKLK